MRPLKIVTRNLRGNKVLCVDTRYVLPKKEGKRHFFHPDDRERAEKFLSEVKKNIEDDPVILTGTQKRDYLTAKDHLDGVSFTEAAVFYRRNHRPVAEKMFSAALAEFVGAKRNSGKSSEYVRIIENRLQAFANNAGEKAVNEYTAAEIQDYLGNRGWSNYTQNRVLIDFRTFWGFCKRNEWCIELPTDRIERIEIYEFEKGILTVDQARVFMGTVLQKDPELCRYFADQLFGFMRETEAFRLRPDQVKETYIELAGGDGKRATKTGAIRYVELNDTWKEWRAIRTTYRPFGGIRMNERSMAIKVAAKEAMLKRKLVTADWWFPRNCLRHSACTYGAKLYGASKAADWAGHSEAIQKKNYRRPVTMEEAKDFWAILPLLNHK